MSAERKQRIEAIVEDYERARSEGRQPQIQRLIDQHPDLMPELERHLRHASRRCDEAGVDPTRSRQQRNLDAPAGQPPERAHHQTGAHEDSLRSTYQHAIPGYEITRELSRGGQGIVFQAIQKSTKRKVAIKLLLHGTFAGQSARRRFDREIELVAQLKHPHVVSILDSGTTDDGRQFAVMDYVRGTPLTQYVRETALSIEETLQLFKSVCETIQYAHQRGVIHRDLKPANIVVDAIGKPYVLDFGLAKQLAEPLASIVTMTEQVVGTLPYMSPEQARGNPDEIDTRTDVYALGVVLYELLTGAYPYPAKGQIADIVRHITDTEPTPPSRAWRADTGIPSASRRRGGGHCPIDNEVETIVLKALAKERERRYESAGQLARDIACYLQGEPIEAKRDSGWYLLRKSLRRHRTPLLFGATILIVIAAAGILLLNARGEVARAKQREAERLLARERAVSNARQAEKLLRSRADLDRASAMLDAAMADDPDYAHAYLLRGTLIGMLGLRAPLEEKTEYVKRARQEFDEAYRRARRRDGPQSTDSEGRTSPTAAAALAAAIDLLSVAGLYSEARELLTRFETQRGGAAGTWLGDLLIPLYEVAHDQLVAEVDARTPSEARLLPDPNAVVHCALRVSLDAVGPFRTQSYEAWINDLMLDSLFVFDEHLMLAANHAMVDKAAPSDDGRTWLVTLRSGLLWHDGKPLTASDIEFTWNTFYRDKPTAITSVRAIDAQTVEFRLTEALSKDIAMLAMNEFVLPRHVFEAIAADGSETARDVFISRMSRHPIGNGPFRLRSEVSDSRVELERWDAYPGPQPYVGGFVFEGVEDSAARVRRLGRGRTDALELTAGEFRWDVNGESFEHVVKTVSPRLQYDYIVWNLDCPLFQDPLTRRALAHAVDLEGLRTLWYGGLYEPCYGPYPPGTWMYNEHVERLAYDVSTASELLCAAGWTTSSGEVRSRGGIPLEFDLLVPEESATSFAGLAVALRQLFNEVGVRARIKTAPFRECLQRLEEGEADAGFSSVIGNPHPSQDAVRFSRSGEKNYGRYRNREVDRLFEQARTATGRQEAQIYKQIHRAIYADQPYLFLWQKPTMWAFNRRIRGVRMSKLGPFGFYPGPRAWWIPHRDSQREASARRRLND